MAMPLTEDWTPQQRIGSNAPPRAATSTMSPPHIPDVLLVLLVLLATGTGGEEILFKSRIVCCAP
jgi:hypothetical protein